jgi:uncharacterized damage-inducible protein DinB
MYHMDVHQLYLESVLKRFSDYNRMAENAIAQLSPSECEIQPAPGSNSIAIICAHMAGNMLSRFTNFLTEDGEKPWRNRDNEFSPVGCHPTGENWHRAWKTLFDTLQQLRPEDLGKTVTIRREPHSVPDAINRQLAHYAYHTGQIVFLAKMIKGEQWKSLSIPKNGSDSFNKKMTEKFQTPPQDDPA